MIVGQLYNYSRESLLTAIQRTGYTQVASELANRAPPAGLPSNLYGVRLEADGSVSIVDADGHEAAATGDYAAAIVVAVDGDALAQTGGGGFPWLAVGLGAGGVALAVAFIWIGSRK